MNVEAFKKCKVNLFVNSNILPSVYDKVRLIS